MYENRTHSVKDGIVSISQPWIRPIVRGKASADVEFASKLSVSPVDGIVRIDRLSWDAYNESEDLALQVEEYKSGGTDSTPHRCTPTEYTAPALNFAYGMSKATIQLPPHSAIHAER